MPTKSEVAEAVERKRETQAQMILLPDDCCKEDADRLHTEAQSEFPLYTIIALNPVSAKSWPLKRVLDSHETFRVV